MRSLALKPSQNYKMRREQEAKKSGWNIPKMMKYRDNYIQDRCEEAHIHHLSTEEHQRQEIFKPIREDSQGTFKERWKK